jgi:hypothetical protein
MTEIDTRRRRSGGRILVATFGIPDEFEGASVVVIFQYIRRLLQADYEIVHLLLLEGPSFPDSAVSNYVAQMKRFGAIEVEVVRSTGFVVHGRTGHRVDQAAFAEAAAKATKIAPDMIVAFDIVPAWVTVDVPTRARLVCLGDLLFQTYFWHAISSVTEDLRALKRLPSALLACIDWRRVYRRVLRNADQVTVFSESSCEQLARLGIHAEYEPYPWPETGTLSGDHAPPDCPTFLFFGNLVGLGSRSALHFMVERVYPRLLSLWGQGGFTILLAGRGHLPEWFRRRITDKPEFKVLGFVENIDDVMGRCHAVLAPISVPVGNRTRILTAMAIGALVIAHENAALGNPALVDGETCYLATDGVGFVKRMLLAVEDRDASLAIIDRARRSYQSQFHPDIASKKLVERVDQLAVKAGSAIAVLQA